MKISVRTQTRVMLFVSLLALAVPGSGAVDRENRVDILDNAGTPMIRTLSSDFAEINEVRLVPENGATRLRGELERQRIWPTSRVGVVWIRVSSEDGILLHEQRAAVRRIGHQHSRRLQFTASLPLAINENHVLEVRHSLEYSR